MKTDLKVSYTVSPAHRISMLVEGTTARGGKYRKVLEIRPETPIDLHALQEFLSDCGYEARNFLPIPEYIQEAREASKAQREDETRRDIRGVVVMEPGGGLPEDSNIRLATKEDIDAVKSMREDPLGHLSRQKKDEEMQDILRRSDPYYQRENTAGVDLDDVQRQGNIDHFPSSSFGDG